MNLNFFIKEYIRWLTPFLFVSVPIYFIFKPLMAISLFFALIIPADRARVKALKIGLPIPSTKTAWKIIGINILLPAILSTYIGLSMDIPEGKFRANMLVNSWLVFTLPIFITSCICFLNEKVWNKAIIKHKTQSM